MPEKLNISQLSEQIKYKYPEYRAVNDELLAKRWLEKFPEFIGKVDTTGLKLDLPKEEPEAKEGFWKRTFGKKDEPEIEEPATPKEPADVPQFEIPEPDTTLKSDRTVAGEVPILTPEEQEKAFKEQQDILAHSLPRDLDRSKEYIKEQPEAWKFSEDTGFGRGLKSGGKTLAGEVANAIYDASLKLNKMDRKYGGGLIYGEKYTKWLDKQDVRIQDNIDKVLEWQYDVPEMKGGVGEMIGGMVPFASMVALSALTRSPALGRASIGLFGTMGYGAGIQSYDRVKEEKGEETNEYTRAAAGLLYGLIYAAPLASYASRWTGKAWERAATKFLNTNNVAVEAAGKAIWEQWLKQSPKEAMKYVTEFAKSTGHSIATMEIITGGTMAVDKFVVGKDITFGEYMEQAKHALASGTLFSVFTAPFGMYSQSRAVLNRQRQQGQVYLGLKENGQAYEVIYRDPKTGEGKGMTPSGKVINLTAEEAMNTVRLPTEVFHESIKQSRKIGKTLYEGAEIDAIRGNLKIHADNVAIRNSNEVHVIQFESGEVAYIKEYDYKPKSAEERKIIITEQGWEMKDPNVEKMLVVTAEGAYFTIPKGGKIKTVFHGSKDKFIEQGVNTIIGNREKQSEQARPPEPTPEQMIAEQVQPPVEKAQAEANTQTAQAAQKIRENLHSSGELVRITDLKGNTYYVKDGNVEDKSGILILHGREKPFPASEVAKYEFISPDEAMLEFLNEFVGEPPVPHEQQIAEELGLVDESGQPLTKEQPPTEAEQPPQEPVSPPEQVIPEQAPQSESKYPLTKEGRPNINKMDNRQLFEYNKEKYGEETAINDIKDVIQHNNEQIKVKSEKVSKAGDIRERTKLRSEIEDLQEVNAELQAMIEEIQPETANILEKEEKKLAETKDKKADVQEVEKKETEESLQKRGEVAPEPVDLTTAKDVVSKISNPADGNEYREAIKRWNNLSVDEKDQTTNEYNKALRAGKKRAERRDRAIDTRRRQEQVEQIRNGEIEVPELTEEIQSRPREYNEWVAKWSINPQEIYNSWKDEIEHHSPYSKLEIWQQETLGRHFDIEQFKNFSDPNYVTDNSALRKYWLRKKGVGVDAIDTWVHQWTYDENSWWYDPTLTIQKVVDFILDNPTNYVRNTTQNSELLRQRYRDVTGVSINNHNEFKPDTEIVPVKQKLLNFIEENKLVYFTTEDLLDEINKNKAKFASEKEYSEIKNHLENEIQRENEHAEQVEREFFGEEDTGELQDIRPEDERDEVARDKEESRGIDTEEVGGIEPVETQAKIEKDAELPKPDRKTELQNTLSRLERELKSANNNYDKAISRHRKLNDDLVNSPEYGMKGQKDIFGVEAGKNILDFGDDSLSDARRVVREAKQEADNFREQANKLNKEIERVKDEIRNQQEFDFELPIEKVIRESEERAEDKQERQQDQEQEYEKKRQERKDFWENVNENLTDKEAERLKELREKFRQKRGGLKSGLDPEELAMGIEIASLLIKAGARRFSKFASMMIEELGEAIIPEIKAWYEFARYNSQTTKYRNEMTPPAEVEKANIYEILKQENVKSVKEIKETLKKEENVIDRPRGSEPDSPRADEVRLHDKPVSDVRGVSGEGAEPADKPIQKEGGIPPGIHGSNVSSPPVGERSDKPVSKPVTESFFGKPASESNAGDYDSRGSDVVRHPREDVQHGGMESIPESIERDALTFIERKALKLKEQQEAEKIPVKRLDPQNIKETLPLLLDEQIDDVVKIENRFFSEEHLKNDKLANGKGMLITNGTGTGKTYTGLGVIKRFVKEGKNNILIVAPSQNVISDWAKSGEEFNLNVNILPDTKTAGKRIVATTYANFRSNDALKERDFDLIVYDESHRLMESKTGTTSNTTLTHYEISNKDELNALNRLKSFHPEYNKLQELINKEKDEWNPLEKDKLNTQIDELRKHLRDNIEPGLKEKAKDAVENTKVLFLSASPFKTHFNLRYANGFLFDWGDKTTYESASRTMSRVDAESRFFLDNFGSAYEWKYHRLQEKSNIDWQAVSMQEVMFAENMFKSGAVSGRKIVSEVDYERSFPLITGIRSDAINEAVASIFNMESKKYSMLRKAASNTFYDYQYSTQLLEALKASAYIPRIHEHLALGRKVLIFHRRRMANIIPPFEGILLQTTLDAREILADNTSAPPEREKAIKALEQVDVFKEEYKDLLEYEKTLNYEPVTEQLKNEFGGAVGFINGSVSQKEKARALKKFNEDNSDVTVLCIQEESGKEGINPHDTTGKYQRVLANLALPNSSINALQIEGRPYRIGTMTNTIFEYPLLGLDLELLHFGRNINRKLSTTENLAIGEQSRDLLKSFSEGLLYASTDAPHANQGTGGKEFDKRMEQQQSDFRRSVLMYQTNQKVRGRRDQRAGIDFFPTPEPVGFKMVEWLGLKTGEEVLEPSAGDGRIAMWFPNFAKSTSIEPSYELFTKLNVRAGGGERRLINDTFENLNIINKYEGIVMNPPYGAGGKTAVEHTKKAFQHLKENGRLITIIPDGGMADKHFAKFMEEGKEIHKGFEPEIVAEIKLPNVTFEQAGTAVKTKIIVIDKIRSSESNVKNIVGQLRAKNIQEVSKYGATVLKSMEQLQSEAERIARETERKEPTKHISLEGATKINELFDSLEKIELPERRKSVGEIVEEKAEPPRKDFDIFEQKHSKTGDDLFMVAPNIYLGDMYSAVNEIAKKYDGYYSSYQNKALGVRNGFTFKTEKARGDFLAELTEKMDVFNLSTSSTELYSPTERALEFIPKEEGTPIEMRSALIRAGASGKELDWKGWSTLQGKKTITKADVRKLLSQEIPETKGEYRLTDNNLPVLHGEGDLRGLITDALYKGYDNVTWDASNEAMTIEANEIALNFGGKVEQIKIDVGSNYVNGELMPAKYETVNSLKITPDIELVALTDGMPMFRFIGEDGARNLAAATRNRRILINHRKAMAMWRKDTPMNIIKLATGWETGKDGHWRYERPDNFVKDVENQLIENQSKYVDGKTGLYTYLSEIEIIAKEYPQLLKDWGDVGINVDVSPEYKTAGQFVTSVKGNEQRLPALAEINIKSSSIKEAAEIVVHEIQHFIQWQEGFALGATPKSAPEREGLSQYQSYWRTAGEVEARNATERLKLTPEQRRRTLAAETEKIARKDQIVVYKGNQIYQANEIVLNNEHKLYVSPETAESITGKLGAEKKSEAINKVLKGLNEFAGTNTTAVKDFSEMFATLRKSGASEVMIDGLKSQLAKLQDKGDLAGIHWKGNTMIHEKGISNITELERSWLHENSHSIIRSEFSLMELGDIYNDLFNSEGGAEYVMDRLNDVYAKMPEHQKMNELIAKETERLLDNNSIRDIFMGDVDTSHLPIPLQYAVNKVINKFLENGYFNNRAEHSRRGAEDVIKGDTRGTRGLLQDIRPKPQNEQTGSLYRGEEAVLRPHRPKTVGLSEWKLSPEGLSYTHPDGDMWITPDPSTHVGRTYSALKELIDARGVKDFDPALFEYLYDNYNADNPVFMANAIHDQLPLSSENFNFRIKNEKPTRKKFNDIYEYINALEKFYQENPMERPENKQITREAVDAILNDDGTIASHIKALEKGVEYYSHVEKMPFDFKETLRGMREFWNDQKYPIRIWQEEIIKRGGKAPYYKQEGQLMRTDPYRDVRNMHGRIQFLSEKFKKEGMEPVIDAIANIKKESGLETDATRVYVLAKHGLENNIRMRAEEFDNWVVIFTQREGREPNAGEIAEKLDTLDKKDYSGLTPLVEVDELPDDRAKLIIKGFESQVSKDAVQKLWGAINKTTSSIVDTWYKTGDITAEKKDELINRFKYFVPLRGWRHGADKYLNYKDSEMGIGKSLQTREGRTSMPDDPIAYLQAVGFKAIREMVVNEVNVEAMKLIAANYGSEFKDLHKLKSAYLVEKEAMIEGEDGVMREEIVYTLYRDENLMPATPPIELFNEGKVYSEKYSQHKRLRTLWQAQQNEVIVRHGGKLTVIVFPTEDIPTLQKARNLKTALALKNMNTMATFIGHEFDARKFSDIAPLRAMATATNAMKQLMTSWSPGFLTRNFPRDQGESAISQWIRTGTPIGKVFFKYVINPKGTTAALYRHMTGKADPANNRMDFLVEKMYEYGGTTGFTRDMTVEQITRKLEKDIKKELGENSNASKVAHELAPLIMWIRFLNQLLEDSTRAGVYAEMVEYNKLSYKDAAFESRTTSTDHNMRGKGTGIIEPVYAFFKAGMNGTQKNLQLAKINPYKFGAMVASFMAAGFASAWIYEIFSDKEEYFRINPYTRQNFLSIPIYKVRGQTRYLTYPMPHFWRGFFALGVNMHDYIVADKITAGEAVGRSIASLISAVTPYDITSLLQERGMTVRPFMPTVVKPLWEAHVNRDFMDNPIAREAFTKQLEEDLRRSKLHKENVNPVAKFITDNLYTYLSGADDDSEYAFKMETRKGKNARMKLAKGMADINPSILEHLVTSYTGGAGVFASDVVKSMYQAVKKNEKFDIRNLPIANSFIKVVPEEKWGKVRMWQERREIAERADLTTKEKIRKLKKDDLEVIMSTDFPKAVAIVKAYSTQINNIVDTYGWNSEEGTKLQIQLIDEAVEKLDKLKIDWK